MVDFAKQLEQHRKDIRISKLILIRAELEFLINATPTSEARNKLTEANLTLEFVRTLPEFKE